MRADSDVEMEEEDPVDIGEDEVESVADIDESDDDGEEEAVNESDGDDDGDDDDDDDDDEIQQQSDEGNDDDDPENEEEDEEMSAAPRLKIKLKLPSQPALSSGNATPVRGFASPPKSSRRYRPIVPESEESADNAESEASEERQPTSRSATGTPSHNTRPMTTRQAVLASVVGSSHVSLDDGSRSKKQPLNETELALRREETARKRKNLTEKKLEDEKAETINRLLKRQSRPRNRRANVDVAAQENAEDGDGDEAVEGVQSVHEEVKPLMYRWISTSRLPPSVKPRTETEKGMLITFSVPTIVEVPSSEKKDVLRPPIPATCAVKGCGAVRKYRLVRNSDIGACGMAHLKILEQKQSQD
jgi:Ino eighty subunit 2